MRRLSHTSLWRVGSIAALLASTGCYTGLGGAGSAGADGSASGAGTDGSEGGNTDGNDGGPADELPAPTTRLFRLTHSQWENTVQDLLYLPEPTGLSSDFRTDPSIGGFLFDNNASTLEVDQALWQSYQRAAVQIAEQVTGDPTLLAAIVPPDGGDPVARAAAFVDELAPRAYRRPLTDAERSELLATFDGAAALYDGVDPFVAGVRLVLETVLQSPHFLYRIETATEADGNVIPLGSYEVAQRLSYFLWDSMPDDTLFDAAAADELVQGASLREHALRMLDDVRARPVVQHFHDQAFDTKKFLNAAPAAAFYPDAPDNLGELALEENHRFIEEVVFAQDGGIATLLTSNETFVNDELARIYGLDPAGFGAEFEKVTLDAQQRKGFLTQVGFLAANSSTAAPDPIHRGVFIAKRLACMNIAAPPNGVPPLPPPEGRSNRQTVEEHTQQPGSSCVGCHSTIINPFGFPFENYDAEGAWRTEDVGPVDAASDVTLDEQTVHVQNGLDLADALATSPSVHQCYTEHWLEFAFGRPFAPEDEAFATRIGTASQSGEMAVKELLIEIVASNAFRNRATQELP